MLSPATLRAGVVYFSCRLSSSRPWALIKLKVSLSITARPLPKSSYTLLVPASKV